MSANKSSNFPRVLVVSHNPFSLVHNNGKTLTAFFRGWPKECIAQIYLTTDIPDFTLCEKYFQLHDFDMVKRCFANSETHGRRVANSDTKNMMQIKNRINTNYIIKFLRNNMFPVFQLAKDLLWKLIGFKSNELNQFIDEFRPQVVFFHSYKDVFAFSIANWICKNRAIPLIMFISDDYVSSKFTLDPFFWIQLFRVKRAYKEAIVSASCVVAGCDKMAEEFKVRFGGNYIVAMNAIPELDLPERLSDKESIRFLYAGNIGLNRWKVLSLIAVCLKELGVEEGMLGELVIYSLNDPTDNQLRNLNVPPYSVFRGALNADQLNSAKTDADVLVHVESFDRKNRHITRLSVSTKIAEYLASRRCIFAVGPEDVASIQYITKYDLGIVVATKDKMQIKGALKKLITDREVRSRYADKGIETARLRHSADKTAEIIFQKVNEAAMY